MIICDGFVGPDRGRQANKITEDTTSFQVVNSKRGKKIVRKFDGELITVYNDDHNRTLKIGQVASGLFMDGYLVSYMC
ncbi:MAG TPA: hypothetical protein PKL04_00605 [Methanofastidiosum sp.]|nr:hypothetical protein [Methanofastidiosum sp.]